MQKKTIWITAAAAGAVLILGGTGIAYAATDGFEQDDDSRTQVSAPANWLDKASEAAITAAGGGTVTGADTSDDADHAYSVDVRRDNGTEVDIELDASFGVVRIDEDNSGDNDSNGTNSTGTGTTGTDTTGTDTSTGQLDAEDAPISAADRASAEKAALAATTKGTVTDVERSDDRDHAWEVEVTFANGTDVDVELTTNFQLVRIDK